MSDKWTPITRSIKEACRDSGVTSAQFERRPSAYTRCQRMAFEAELGDAPSSGDFRAGLLAGWEAALIEAERQCRRMWDPNGDTVQATTSVELVELRNAIKARSGS